MGPAVPERDLQNMDGEKIDWRHILSNQDDARDQLFRIFPSGKTGTRRREHRHRVTVRVYWFPWSVYWFPICDGRNCELLNSMMTQICSRNRNRPSSKKQNVFGRTKPHKTKGCKFGEAWRMSTLNQIYQAFFFQSMTIYTCLCLEQLGNFPVASYYQGEVICVPWKWRWQKRHRVGSHGKNVRRKGPRMNQGET